MILHDVVDNVPHQKIKSVPPNNLSKSNNPCYFQESDFQSCYHVSHTEVCKEFKWAFVVIIVLTSLPVQIWWNQMFKTSRSASWEGIPSDLSDRCCDLQAPLCLSVVWEWMSSVLDLAPLFCSRMSEAGTCVCLSTLQASIKLPQKHN